MRWKHHQFLKAFLVIPTILFSHHWTLHAQFQCHATCAFLFTQSAFSSCLHLSLVLTSISGHLLPCLSQCTLGLRAHCLPEPPNYTCIIHVTYLENVHYVTLLLVFYVYAHLPNQIIYSSRARTWLSRGVWHRLLGLEDAKKYVLLLLQVHENSFLSASYCHFPPDLDFKRK